MQRWKSLIKHHSLTLSIAFVATTIISYQQYKIIKLKKDVHNLESNQKHIQTEISNLHHQLNSIEETFNHKFDVMKTKNRQWQQLTERLLLINKLRNDWEIQEKWINDRVKHRLKTMEMLDNYKKSRST